jgi:membrane protein
MHSGEPEAGHRRVDRADPARGPGRDAHYPAAIPWRGRKQVLRRAWREITSARFSLNAAGCAFWATLALFPAISMLISITGLLFDPASVEPQLEVLRGLLPPSAFSLIAERVHTLVSHGRGELGVSLLISTVLALWSASTGIKSMLSALNLAYEEQETRGIVRFQAIGLLMTLGAIVGVILAIALLVLLPVAIDFVGLDAYSSILLRLSSFGVLVVFVLLALSVLYRFGPSRQQARWQWITPGSLVATVLWLAASALFSFYVGHLASYDAVYGPLAAVVGVMLWFWMSAYVVLLGAELNSELELQTAGDTAAGPPRPMARRGANVADHGADET